GIHGLISDARIGRNIGQRCGTAKVVHASGLPLLATDRFRGCAGEPRSYGKSLASTTQDNVVSLGREHEAVTCAVCEEKRAGGTLSVVFFERECERPFGLGVRG